MKVKQVMRVFGFREAGNGVWMARDPFADLKVIKRVPGTCNIFRVYSVFKDQWVEFEHIELEVFLTQVLNPPKVPVSKEFQKCWDEGVEPEWFSAPPPKELSVETDPLPELDKSRSDIKWLWDRTLFLTNHGSHAYGTSLPTSDNDYKGFAIPPKAYFHGYAKRFEQAEFKGEPDMVVYDIRKFFKLAADCNPSIIEVLFTDPSDHQIVHPLAAKILQKRDLFISRKAKHTFSGYAVSQLKKIRSHKRWIDNGPQKPPERSDFGLPANPLIPKNQMDAVQAAIRKQIEAWDVDLTHMDDAARIDLQIRIAEALAEQGVLKDEQWKLAGKKLGLDDNFIDLMDRERQFGNAVNEWRSYQTWLATRNEKRSELERKWGYDTKHGMHLIRLMRMCGEILRGEGVKVKRPDAEELLAIRNGLWTYEQLLDWADKQEVEFERLYAISPLPKSPPVNELDALLTSVVEEGLDILPGDS